MTPLSAFADRDFGDANNTTFDETVVTLDNSQAGQTTFAIDTNRTTIGWEDLQQPEGNTLEFNFTNPDSIVLNYIGAQHPSNLNGTVISNGTVAFSNPFGIFIGDNAVLNVGDLIAIGADVSREDFMTSQDLLLQLTGTIENNGMILAEGNVSLFGRSVTNNGSIVSENGSVFALAGQRLSLFDWTELTSSFLAPKNFFGILADGTVENRGSITAPNAALFGGRVLNYGDIEIADGSLLMVAADAVWVTRFDDPVLIKLPNVDRSDDSTARGTAENVDYAIENLGRIDAGLGHVRLAASDPLGFAIRQGTGGANESASITAQRIEIEGGAVGRVHLGGTLDASRLDEDGQGGEINITGSMIVLQGTSIEASGYAAGGTIQIGGEQEGRGDLQRARAVIVDEDTEIRADAIVDGDGGRVIVFAEDLTSVDGNLSARGGRDGGDGGFVETSGLRNFQISRTPDLSAPRGAAGSWLIDPFNITITTAPPASGCPGEGISCLNKAIDAILAPNFDDAGFDGILRTVNPDDNVPNANFVTADLIADALATGTSVTLSTQAFGLDPGSEDGDINIDAAIVVDSNDVLEGTTAKLTLLAARNINVNTGSDIAVLATTEGRRNLALSVELRANDFDQIEPNSSFSTELLEGDVLINADIVTGGGSVTIVGTSVVQQTGRLIDTDGGSVDIRTGSIDGNGLPVTFVRNEDEPAVDLFTPVPLLEIAGSIDTTNEPTNGSDPGGVVFLVASSINVETNQRGDDLLEIVTGQLMLSGSIQSGGGDITLSGGNPPSDFGNEFTGNVNVQGSIDSGGGDVSIIANHADPNGDTDSLIVSFIGASPSEGGVIELDVGITPLTGLITDGGTVSIGSERTQSIQFDGLLDTTSSDTTENGTVQLVALDESSADNDNAPFGFGEIIIGAINASGTTINTSALGIEARNITFSDGAGANPVVLTATGSATQDLASVLGPLSASEIRITGDRQIAFNQNTELNAESIVIIAAQQPSNLNTLDPPTSETRLVFGGTNGAGQLAADGVRLNADAIVISVGDGGTGTSDGFSPAVTDPEFDLQRLTRASYDGLQLRASDASFRPENLLISQDGDFTITNASPTSEGQLDLGAAFDTATIGVNGFRTLLESSDGVLTIEDAVALNNTGIPQPDSDDGKSFVVLNGGLYLPDASDTPTFADDTVVFGDGIQALGSAGTTAFDVERLTVSTSGDFTVRQQILDSITRASELVFEAGRITATDLTAGRGALTVDGGLTLMADDRLALLAGGSGFGDLEFAGASTTLVANDIELRAGGGEGSENTDNTTYSRVTGVQSNVTFQDANGGVFGDSASSAASFSYRQDAAIDAETDLPDLAQFGLDPLAGFRVAGDMEYSVRSDKSNIDLDDGVIGTNEGDRFRNAALSLVGLDLNSVPAIDVSDEFSFVGKKIELGGINNFTFTQRLATAFNRTGMDADEEITLRAGLSGVGDLNFNRGDESSVIVKAPRINLIAGTGLIIDSGIVTEAKIDVRGAEFDLAGPAGSTPTFVFQAVSFFEVRDLPDSSQFIGGQSGLPDVLAIRSDIGLVELVDFDIDLLPIDLIDDPGRLIIEAESLSMSQTNGTDLDLTSNPNLNLRLRTNALTLVAADANLNTAADAVVMIGPRSTDTQPQSGVDGDLDDESLLIEAFAVNTPITITNASTISEDPTDSDRFDLAEGRGPTFLSIQQDGAATPTTLFNRNAVSGRLERTIFDRDDGTPNATSYAIQSVLNAVRITPENVNGSTLTVGGIEELPTDPNATELLEGIIFDPGTGSNPGVFEFENLFASTQSSIIIQNGTQISANERLSLTAGTIPIIADDLGDFFGKISFEAGAATTSLTGNVIVLTAGPAFTIDAPDADGDGERDPIADALLPRIDFTNLDEIILTGNAEDSRLDIRQNASLDSVVGGTGDYLTPMIAGAISNPDQWQDFQVNVVQGDLILRDLDLLRDRVENLTARTSNLDAALIANMPDGAGTLFADFGGTVEFRSNDITFVSTDPGTPIDLATENLLLVSSDIGESFLSEDEVSQLRDDAEPTRPIVRIHQAADFVDTELARPDQYIGISIFGDRDVRSDLAGIDIELKSTIDGATLIFDNDLRARVTTSNLILDSAGDVEIMLDGLTPGFDGLDYAALQLTSLEITTGNDSAGGTVGDGTITIRPFMVNSNPEPLTIETAGDQRFDGELLLETTFATRGRNLTFTGDVIQTTTPDAGLRVSASGKVVFEANIGSSTNPLDHLWLTFNNQTTSTTPGVEFGQRTDSDGDGIFETPVASNQEIWTLEDILFAAYDFSEGDRTGDIDDSIDDVDSLPELEALLETLGLGRDHAASFATIGKASGDLSFNSSNGAFIMASGEKLSVGGRTEITVAATDGIAALGDVSTLDLAVTANEIGLVRRASGAAFDRSGDARQNPGPSISVNTIDFGSVTPVEIGRGRAFRFGVPNPFDATALPSFLGDFPVFELFPSSEQFVVSDFRFFSTTGNLAGQVPSLRPIGASRSDLSGAFGPKIEPIPGREMPETRELQNSDRLIELAVHALDTPNEIRLARLESVAVINDLDFDSDDETATVTIARLDADYADDALALFESLFGYEGERTTEVREILQEALDRYLANTRARRVVGFELRRFVKNRPSTLLEAYRTLESLDDLFRYHRRLGLSPGEYKRIQNSWLREIQPDGITLDELAEAIHPSRYVRGSDILDIFGR